MRIRRRARRVTGTCGDWRATHLVAVVEHELVRIHTVADSAADEGHGVEDEWQGVPRSEWWLWGVRGVCWACVRPTSWLSTFTSIESNTKETAPRIYWYTELRLARSATSDCTHGMAGRRRSLLSWPSNHSSAFGKRRHQSGHFEKLAKRGVLMCWGCWERADVCVGVYI